MPTASITSTAAASVRNARSAHHARMPAGSALASADDVREERGLEDAFLRRVRVCLKEPREEETPSRMNARAARSETEMDDA
jgi:hypothetical protein